MAQLPVEQGLVRFQENEERIDKFVNDRAGYTATGGQAVPSLRALAQQVAQFFGGIYQTTSAGIAATTNGQYFSVPSGSVASAILNLYQNVSGTATLVAQFPSKAIAQYGRVQFTRRGTTFLFNDVAGTSVEVGWTTLRFWKGDSTQRKVADRALTALAAGQALYIDVTNDVPTNDYPVLEDTLTNIAVDIVQGTKILLVANYEDGYLVGEIAEALVNKEINSRIDAAQTSINNNALQARWARSRLTSSQSTFTHNYDGGTGVLTVSWTGLRLLRGDAGLAVINDVTNYALANKRALYIDLTQSSPISVLEGDYAAIAVDCVTGSKYLLVANYFGSVVGEAAGFLRSEQVENKAEAAQTNSNDSRRLLTGCITSAIPSGGNFTVSISEGRSYRENNGGLSEYKIAPLADVLLAPGEGLVVDFVGGTKDDNDRYIPVKYQVAQQAASGWMTAKKYVLVGDQ